MHVKLHVWRQAGPDAAGTMETYDAPDISEYRRLKSLKHFG